MTTNSPDAGGLAEVAEQDSETPANPSAEEQAQEQTQDTAPEAAEQAPETEAAQGEHPEQGRPQRKGGWQRQIERLEQQNQMLLEELTKRGGQQPAAPAKEKTADEKATEFIDQLVQQRLAAAEAQREQARQMAELERRTQEVRARHPDFDEVIASAGHIRVPQHVNEAVLTSPHSADIMYLLASDQAELARISALPPLAAAREIGRLEAKASSTAAPKAKPNAVIRKPAAPAPIAPVTARGPSTVKRPEDMTYEEYSAWREAKQNR